MPRSENLVIMFTDIVGFTQRTADQSRAENKAMLATHDQLLRPIVAACGGRWVKSIGDAMLVTFRSPTDAVRCGMAMQDRLWEHNRTLPARDRIHIRVALNLGEVRLERGDVFGPPVNLAARLEGSTPADEVWFSEAVYLAMNKAEVPSERIGPLSLRGIAEPVVAYRVPHHQSARLVVEGTAPPETEFPFGGLHRQLPAARSASTIVALAGWRATALLPGVIQRLQAVRTHLVAGLGRLMALRAGPGLQLVSQHLRRRPYLALAPVLAVALVASVTAFMDRGADAWLTTAEPALRAGQWEEAERQSAAALARDPADAAAWLLRGHAACGARRWQDCLAAYRKALEYERRWQTDDRLLDNAIQALGPTGDEAQALLRAHPSDSARERLRARVARPGYWGRRRALALLEERGDASRTIRVQAALLDLDDGPDCPRRRQAIQTLRALEAVEALEALDRLQAIAGRSLLHKDYCLVKEAQVALGSLRRTTGG